MTKIFADMSGNSVGSLISLPDTFDPAVLPPPFTDVTAVTGIAVGWVKGSNGTFSAPVPIAPSTSDLTAYANAKQWSLATGGYVATIGGQTLTFATDLASQALITGKALRLSQPNPPATVDWQFATGFVSIAAADFLAAATEIADFVQATFDELKTVLTEISAGQIASYAAIDQAFATVPA